MNEEYVSCDFCFGSGDIVGEPLGGDMFINYPCKACDGKGYFKYEHNDPIKPSHYHTGNIDVIKFSEENFGKGELKGFYRMNVLKYVTRYDKKNGLEDLEKATFYLDKLKELEGEGK